MDLNPTNTSENATRSENFEGGDAWIPDDPRHRLYLLTVNNLIEDTYYESDSESLDKLQTAFEDTVADGHAEFPLRLAAYARQEMNLRDVPQVLLVWAAHTPQTQAFVKAWTPHIIQRADEPCTVVAAHDMLFGGTIPKPLKKGINEALHNFDYYQFSKYNRDQREVSIRDVINRTHPKPQDPLHDEIFEQLIRGPLDSYPDVETMDPPMTWETHISEHGNTREAWEAVLGKMGLFATIRNLRNILEAGVNPNTIVNDPEIPDGHFVRESRIYPFRFYQAYKAIKDARVSSPVIEQWLSNLIDVASENVPDAMDETLVAVDLSGSMRRTLSERSDLSRAEIASLFGAICAVNGSAHVVVFGEEAMTARIHTDSPVLQATDTIRGLSSEVGGSTNGWKAIDMASDMDAYYDRIVMLTDEQIYDSRPSRLGLSTSDVNRDRTVEKAFGEYRETVNPDAKLYMVDLASYGEPAMPESEHAITISGWTDDVFDYIARVEEPGQIVDEVAGYVPETME